MNPFTSAAIAQPTLPRPLNRFVGRDEELRTLAVLLTDPACHLITIMGPGGMGKTRLALEAAQLSQDHFAAGVCFVNLQPLSDPTQLPTALADALGCPLSGADPIEQQLLRFLANKEMLLLLDNFDHLLPGADFLAKLLAYAPTVKLIVSSRTVLNLQEEWLLPLAGLAFPSAGAAVAAEALARYSAVQLFVERVRRLRPHFALAEEAAAVAHICQLVEGMPLALELAATWAKSLRCAEIAAEIERGLDFLTTTQRNTPERHRSMLVVCQQSWQQLTAHEQTVFARLSVFRSGFRRAAAERVAGATLATLTALVDKSLVRWEASGRYQIHELLRQFGKEQLTQLAQDPNKIRSHHAAYYTDFLHERHCDILGQRQLETVGEIREELDNLRAAWLWSVAQRDQQALEQAAVPLALFHHIRSRFREGAELFAHAVYTLTSDPPSVEGARPLALLLTQLGFLYMRTVELEKMHEVLTRSQHLYTKHNLLPPLGFGTDPRLGLGIVAMYWGDLQTGLHMIQAALQAGATLDHALNREGEWYWLAVVHLALQQVELAQQAVQQALALVEQSGNRWFAAYVYDLLGQLAFVQCDQRAAQHYYELGYRHHEEVGDQEGMAQALSALADLALARGDSPQASSYLGQSLALLQEFQQRSGMAEILIKLGQVALRSGDLEASRQHWCRALRLSLEAETPLIALIALLRLAQWLRQVGALLLTVEVCSFLVAKIATNVVSFRMSDKEPVTKADAEQMLAALKGRLPPAHYAAAYERGQQAELAQIGTLVLTALATPLAGTPALPVAAQTRHRVLPTLPGNATLIEPLTGRELEILHLIAAGHTNHAIADKLILSPGTVKWYTSQIYGKLAVTSRTQAIVEAHKLNLLEQ